MSRKITIGIILLFIVTGIVGAIHLMNQDAVECMVITQKNQQVAVTFDDLNREAFSGNLINGKGDVTFHEYTGVLLADLLKSKGIDLTNASGVTVTSADNYSVVFTAEEILQADRVYAAITADGKKIEGIVPGSDGVQVIVFGDPNSRRCVRFAQKITVNIP
ncbi:MAG: hypothetical protein IJB47_00600 [Oscillospiraceae bacterium]|nr:hypothetical protein [Oscillospiraceae bacterium]